MNSFKAYDKRNKKTYKVLSISWTWGDILRKYYKNVPEGYWVPEAVVVILDNGKTRTFNYHPNRKTYMKLPNGRKAVYSYAQRDLHDLTLMEDDLHDSERHELDYDELEDGTIYCTRCSYIPNTFEWEQVHATSETWNDLTK